MAKNSHNKPKWVKIREAKQKLREDLLRDQDGKCYYCGHKVVYESGIEAVNLPDNFATLDHIVPKAKHNTLVANSVVACYRCNNIRGDKDAGEFLYEIAAA